MTETTSAGHLIVRQLEAEGVERVYIVPGESYLDVIDGLHESTVRTVICRQEGGAGIMAMTEGRLTGRPGVAMVTRGPGAANAQIAMHTAAQDGSPLVLFVGLIPQELRGRFAFQEFALESWFADSAKAVFTLDDAASAAEVTAKAMRLALAGRPGPVVVGLPEEVLRESVPAVTVQPAERSRPAGSAADHDLLERAVAEAERPLAVVGGEPWTAAGTQALREWAESRGVAVVSDFRAYDLIDNDSPSWIGTLGYGRDVRLAETTDEADLVIFIGAHRTDVLSDEYTRMLEAKTIVISADAALTGHFGRTDAHILADPSAFLVEAGAAETAAEPSQWLQDARARWAEYETPVTDGEFAGVDLGALLAGVNERLADDAIVTFGAGNYALWPQRYLPARGFPSVVAPKNGAMGIGVPAAVAASLASPGRQVVSFAGDGCFLMNGQELATAVAHGASFVLFVIDNSRYGTIVQHQEREYPGRPSGTTLDNPDFAALGTAYGALGLRLDSTETIDEVLETAFDHDGVVLVHVITDPGLRGPGAITNEPVRSGR